MHVAATRNASHSAASSTASDEPGDRGRRAGGDAGDQEDERPAAGDEREQREEDLRGLDVHGREVWGRGVAPPRHPDTERRVGASVRLSARSSSRPPVKTPSVTYTR